MVQGARILCWLGTHHGAVGGTPAPADPTEGLASRTDVQHAPATVYTSTLRDRSASFPATRCSHWHLFFRRTPCPGERPGGVRGAGGLRGTTRSARQTATVRRLHRDSQGGNTDAGSGMTRHEGLWVTHMPAPSARGARNVRRTLPLTSCRRPCCPRLWWKRTKPRKTLHIVETPSDCKS